MVSPSVSVQTIGFVECVYLNVSVYKDIIGKY